jgi:single-stranded-DNA-specific exonuclease
MISISGKNWEEKITNKNSIKKLKQDYNFSETLSKLVISRKFDPTELNSMDNDLKLNNVFLKNDDFEKSIKLVTSSINNKEKICILGDYDVDGSAATSLFVRFFESINHPFFYYIPDREKDG